MYITVPISVSKKYNQYILTSIRGSFLRFVIISLKRKITKNSIHSRKQRDMLLTCLNGLGIILGNRVGMQAPYNINEEIVLSSNNYQVKYLS